jgi:hypothetical protein
VSGSSRSSASVSTKFIRAAPTSAGSLRAGVQKSKRSQRYVRLEKKKGRTYLAIFGNVVEIRGSYRRQL